jgi:hypothetical protein
LGGDGNAGRWNAVFFFNDVSVFTL